LCQDSERDAALAQKAALSSTIDTLQTRVFNALGVLAKHRRKWGRGGWGERSVAAMIAAWRFVAQASCAHVRNRLRALRHRQHMLRRNSFHALLSHCSDVYARADIADRVGARRAAFGRSRLLRRSVSAWRQLAVGCRLGRDRRAGAVLMMRRRVAVHDMGMMLNTWRGGVRWRRRISCGMSQLALKLQRSAAGLAMRLWQESAREGRRLEVARGRVIARLLMRAAATALSSWGEYVSNAIAVREAEEAEEAARRVHEQYLAQQQQDAERLRLEEENRRVRQLERASAATAAEEEKQRRVEEQQREMERREAEKREEYRQRIVERVCQRLRHALVSSALLTWQGNAHARARMRELGAKVAARLQGMCGWAVLRRWRAASALTRKRRPRLLWLLGRSRGLTLSSALGCWRSVTSECLALRRKEDERREREAKRLLWEEAMLERESAHAREREEWQAALQQLEEEVDTQRRRVQEGGVQAQLDLERTEQLWKVELDEVEERRRQRVVGGILRRTTTARLLFCLEHWSAAVHQTMKQRARAVHTIALIRRRGHGRVLTEAFHTWLLTARRDFRRVRLLGRLLARLESRRGAVALHAWFLFVKQQRRNREAVSDRTLLACARRRRRQASAMSVWRRVCMRGHVTRLQQVARLQQTMTVWNTARISQKSSI